MMIFAATDFTTEASEATRLAASLARSIGAELRLVHVLEADSLSPLSFNEKWLSLDEARSECARKLLNAEMKSLKRDGFEISTAVLRGDVMTALLHEVHALSPELLVIGGSATPGAASYRGIAEELARALPCAVLVARPYAARLTAALDEHRRLRVLVAVDGTLSADAAISWVRWFRDHVPCDIIAHRHYWPPAEHHRLGIPVDATQRTAHPKVVEALEREIRARFTGLDGVGDFTVHVEPRWDELTDKLSHGARDANADLVVVGTHRRSGLSRLIHGSVSLSVLRFSDCPVVCVGNTPGQVVSARKIHDVLVATDLSDSGNACIAQAFELLHGGVGVVHIFHVAGEPLIGRPPHETRRELSETELEEIRIRLRRFVPEEFEQSVKTEIIVENAQDAAAAITQAAERANVDAVVVGASGRGAFTRLVLGSVAQNVIDKATRPVLVVRHRPR